MTVDIKELSAGHPLRVEMEKKKRDLISAEELLQWARGIYSRFKQPERDEVELRVAMGKAQFVAHTLLDLPELPPDLAHLRVLVAEIEKGSPFKRRADFFQVAHTKLQGLAAKHGQTDPFQRYHHLLSELFKTVRTRDWVFPNLSFRSLEEAL